jgi:hypothetical protein
MAYDQSGGANTSEEEHKAGKRAGRKKLSESGLPQTQPTDKEQNAANRMETTVKHSLKRTPQETKCANEK